MVQESFARALHNQAQYRGEGPLEAWIWRIAIRTALERRRGSLEVPLADVLDPQLAQPERDPKLAAALKRLPPRRRLIVFLRYVAELSYSDIARVCGISEGTVAATLTQARAALADELGYTGRPKETSAGGNR